MACHEKALKRHQCIFEAVHSDIVIVSTPAVTITRRNKRCLILKAGAKNTARVARSKARCWRLENDIDQAYEAGVLFCHAMFITAVAMMAVSGAFDLRSRPA